MAWTRAIASVNAACLLIIPAVLTHGGGLLAKVRLLVPAHEALCLRLGSRSAGELLVEAHDLLHAHGIGGRANGLVHVSHRSQSL
jgi:hypothetical protein